MDWTIHWDDEAGGAACKVQLPTQLVAGEKLRACLAGGQELSFVWEESLRTLVVFEGDGLERHLALRSQRSQRLPSEPGWDVELDIRSTLPPVSLKVNASPLASGEAARQSQEDAKGVVVRSPMTGKVLQVLASQEAQVSAGEALLIIEAMKMENKIFAPKAGKIEQILVKAGDLVQVGAALIQIQATLRG